MEHISGFFSHMRSKVGGGPYYCKEGCLMSITAQTIAKRHSQVDVFTITAAMQIKSIIYYEQGKSDPSRVKKSYSTVISFDNYQC